MGRQRGEKLGNPLRGGTRGPCGGSGLLSHISSLPRTLQAPVARGPHPTRFQLQVGLPGLPLSPLCFHLNHFSWPISASPEPFLGCIQGLLCEVHPSESAIPTRPVQLLLSRGLHCSVKGSIFSFILPLVLRPKPTVNRSLQRPLSGQGKVAGVKASARTLDTPASK